jgi:hypothetical protein
MQQNIPMPALWDAEFPKQRMQAAIERAKYAQSQQDWKLAEMETARQVSNVVEHYAVCRSARCRRARRCVDNQAPCQRLWESELKPAEMQRFVEEAYVRNPAGTSRRRLRRPAPPSVRRGARPNKRKGRQVMPRPTLSRSSRPTGAAIAGPIGLRPAPWRS